jgi:hypothetical protein
LAAAFRAGGDGHCIRGIGDMRNRLCGNSFDIALRV